jgi:hypothetical protein
VAGTGATVCTPKLTPYIPSNLRTDPRAIRGACIAALRYDPSNSCIFIRDIGTYYAKSYARTIIKNRVQGRRIHCWGEQCGRNLFAVHKRDFSVDGMSRRKCPTCGDGQVAINGNTSCQGYTVNTTGNKKADNVLLDNTCTQCSAGSVAEALSTDCTKCVADEYTDLFNGNV